MKTLNNVKKVIFAGLFLILSIETCFSQNSAESDFLSFKSGSFSNQYYIGNQMVSYNAFIQKLGEKSEQSVKMFEAGRNVCITGIVISYVGSFCAGYDLGGRLAGAKGNTVLLAGGGVVLVGGLIMSYVGEKRMKKALSLYKSNSMSFSISPAQTGIGLCINF